VQLYKALGGGWETQDRPQGAATPASGSANHPGK
jgi:hypothetical protein